MCCNKGDKFIVKQRDKIVIFLLIIATLFSTISFKAAESECATDELSSLNVPKEGGINYIDILKLIIQSEKKLEKLDSINCELMTRIVLPKLSENERFYISICGYICCCYWRCCDCLKILRKMAVFGPRGSTELRNKLENHVENIIKSINDLSGLEECLRKRNLGKDDFCILALEMLRDNVCPKLMATRDLVCSRIFDKIRYI